MQTIFTRVCFSIFVLIIFLCCEVPKKSLHRAYIYNYKNDSVEIELPYVEKGVGNVHTWDLRRWKDFATDWIYISKLNSTVSADSILMTGERRNFQFLFRNVKGQIIITNTTLTVDLMVPEYEKDVIVKWVKYELNGKYKWK